MCLSSFSQLRGSRLWTSVLQSPSRVRLSQAPNLLFYDGYHFPGPVTRRPLPGTRRQVFGEIPRHEHSQVDRRAATFAEPVVTIGIRHVVELLAKFDQAIHQPFGDLKMGIGLARTVND